MKQLFAVGIALVAWFAVVTQYGLMLENRLSSIPETTIRFFSFFTILTNSLVAIYFSLLSLSKNRMPSLFRAPGSLTAVTVYISIVGLVYQLVLRWIWEPQGLQMIVDELLHSVIPVMVVFYWLKWEQKAVLTYQLIPKWLIYPFVYLIYILIRGSFSGFYPYPFVNVDELGFSRVVLNSLVLVGLFVLVALLFVALGKRMGRSRLSSQ